MNVVAFGGHAVWLAAIVMATACGADDESAETGAPCAGAKCDDPLPDDFACKDVRDASGRAPNEAFLSALQDPIARLVLKRPGSCPDNLGQSSTSCAARTSRAHVPKASVRGSSRASCPSAASCSVSPTRCAS